jgi:hypothetical protein
VCGCGVCECVRVLVWVCNIIVGARAREGFSPVVLSRRPERGGPFPHSPWVPRPFRPCICRESSQFDLGLVVGERPNQSDATPKADPIGLPGRPPLSPGRPALGPGQIQRQRPAELRILQRQRIRSRRRTPTSCRRVILLLSHLLFFIQTNTPKHYYVTITNLTQKVTEIILTLKLSQNCLWQTIKIVF